MKHSKQINRVLKKAQEINPNFKYSIGNVWNEYITSTTKHDRKKLSFELYCKYTLEGLMDN